MFIKQASIPPPMQPFQSKHHGYDQGSRIRAPLKHEHNHPQLENIIIPALETDDEKLLCLSKVNRVHSTSTTYAQGFAQAALPSSCSAWLRGLGTLSSANKCVLHLQYPPPPKLETSNTSRRIGM